MPTVLSPTTAPAPKSLSSWSGSAVVHGRAVLTCRRYLTPEKPNNALLFDVNLYLYGSTSADHIVGLCFYFKQANDRFDSEDEPEVADVTANITFMPRSEEAVKSLLPEDASPSEYSFIGELIRLDLIGLQSQGFDCRRRPIFSVSGLASPVDNTTRSFTLTASPYTKLAKDNKFPSAFLSTFTIPETPRWSKLPTIAEGGYVTAEGFGVSVARDSNGFVQTIIVEAEKVTLQGKPSMPPIRKSLPISSTAGVKRRNKFSYADSVKKARTS
ncbi:hypothetical protein BT96DRAFT_1100515 [Gymnopus androsaceus JB14]|uniref:Uncharacterized protein n=1 Tax=Gymnopus androsaceus JB14 TaxID=1447944 RepID=A0A6A4GF99_9AGAR|nr:hypothetical protein BT96DRAFT_1100515 [Gymnopus androsaceus JB14]